jgi:hypothetical protein
MTGKVLGKHTQMYADNPNKVAIIASFENNEMLARALLWTTDDGTKILDSIYGIRSGRIEIINYCNKNNIINIRSKFFRKTIKNYKISLDLKHNTVPYVDTFVFGILSDDYRKVKLTAYIDKNSNVVFSDHGGKCFWLNSYFE